MGLFDLNPLSLIGNAAQAVSHEFLPKDLQFVGDIVALGADYESGNWMKGIEDLQKLFTDLPQHSASSNSAPGSEQPSGTSWRDHSSEAPPPPRYAASEGHVVRGTPPTAKAAIAATSPLSPTSANQTASSGSSHATAETTTQPAPNGSTTAQATTSQSTASTGPGDPFFNQSDADLMNQVANGQIPDSVTKDPAKMRELQARMNQISEMNQLISQMMAAIHEMQKQVIQNIRA